MLSPMTCKVKDDVHIDSHIKLHFIILTFLAVLTLTLMYQRLNFKAVGGMDEIILIKFFSSLTAICNANIKDCIGTFTFGYSDTDTEFFGTCILSL